MYIKQLEIDNFKSFANKATIPLREGFTTVSGPNGSGKSNIIDSIMFALGLRTGSALRVENLSDFITTFNNRNEATVKVIFGGVDGDNELSVTRSIKKTKQGFASTYYLNDKIDTLTNIRSILEQYNITPNSFNVMMQGDVNSIVMCSPKARRAIIDEIAGVADFDRRIEQATNELKTVEQRVQAASLILSEVEKTLEQLREEREVALKYKALQDEKNGLESQINKVKFFDLKRNLEIAHNNILQANKQLKEEEFNKKDIDEKIKLVNEKYKELDDKLKEQGEDERNKLKDAQSDLSARIQIKKNAIDYSDKQIQQGLQSIENAKNGIQSYQKKIESEKLNIQLSNDKIEILKNQLEEKKEELNKKVQEISGLSSSADKYIQERNTVSKDLDSLKDKDTELLKLSLQKEMELKQLKDGLTEAKTFVENAEKAKLTFDDDRSLKELQVKDLKSELDELKELQAKTMQKLDDAKTAIEDFEFEERAAFRKLSDIEASRRAIAATNAAIPLNTVMNAKLEGVHGPLMNLGKVDEEYSTALDIAFGGRLANIVVDDTHTANVAMELLKSSRAGRATFLPLNKMKKAPGRLQLPKNSGVIDFAINLVDFDDMYLDVFFYAVADTLIVEDAEVAEGLIGKYRMVTLDGKLYEKSAAITGGYIKKSSFGFGQNDDKEIENAKQKLNQLQEKHNLAVKEKKELETKLEQIRMAHSGAATEYEKAKLELSNMTRQFESSQSILDTKKTFIADNEPKYESLTSELDKIEAKRVDLSDKIQVLQDKLAELDNLLNDKDLKELKEKTQGLESDIRNIQTKLSAANDELKSHENNIKFNEQLIDTKNQDIQNILKNNENLENDKVVMREEIVQLEKQTEELIVKISVIDEKIGELLKQKQEINDKLIELQTNSKVKESDLIKIREQIESYKTRRKELEPQLKEAENILENAGVDVAKLEPVEISIDELNLKIQRLDKRMKDLGDVNMRAIVSYEEKAAKKQELDNRISTLTVERQSILDKMNGFEKDKKEAFMKTYTAINENFKDIYHQLSEGEGRLILENENDPLSAGMTIEAKPRDKTTNNKLGALSGGEKALTALALVFSIQKYLPAPFYALDEVDASLDTMNVERISEMIKKQSEDTQFLVVSHRRPMIEAAVRTIGVTQKEKGKTKVTGVTQ